jgi:hypothetical protein
LADQKKEEGNELYKASNYREALQRYSEAISKFSFISLIGTVNFTWIHRVFNK